MKREVSTLLIILLASSLHPTTIRIEISAQREMSPEWTIENGNHFVKVAVSADGRYIAATTNNTNMLHVFQGNQLLWASPTSQVYSLAMSANGKYIAVGTKRGFYLFDRKNSHAIVESQLDYEESLVAISANGSVIVVGTTSCTHDDNIGTRLHLFKRGRPLPIWNKTLPGILESLSISDDGSYVVASTSRPGILYLFLREEATPLWTYDFGERSGGARISNNGDYVVAVGGNQTSEKDMRIYQFKREIAIPRYMKVISELPSFSGLSISANGSIFAISYTGSNNLIFFNLALPPYGYGPGSVLNMALPSRRVSMSMSTDGRHIIVGTADGVFIYEYSNRQLDLTKQYTTSKPFVIDIASSTNGQFIIAAAATMGQNNKHSTIYLFDNFKEPQANLDPKLQLSLLIVTSAIVLVAAVYVLGKRSQHAHASG